MYFFPEFSTATFQRWSCFVHISPPTGGCSDSTSIAHSLTVPRGGRFSFPGSATMHAAEVTSGRRQAWPCFSSAVPCSRECRRRAGTCRASTDLKRPVLGPELPKLPVVTPGMPQAAKLSLHLPTAGGLDPSEPQTRQWAHDLCEHRAKTQTSSLDLGQDRDPRPLLDAQVLGHGLQEGALPHPLTSRRGSRIGSDARFLVTLDGLLAL